MTFHFGNADAVWRESSQRSYNFQASLDTLNNTEAYRRFVAKHASAQARPPTLRLFPVEPSSSPWQLPREVWALVFSYAHPGDIPQLRAVCKHFYNALLEKWGSDEWWHAQFDRVFHFLPQRLRPKVRLSGVCLFTPVFLSAQIPHNLRALLTSFLFSIFSILLTGSALLVRSFYGCYGIAGNPPYLPAKVQAIHPVCQTREDTEQGRAAGFGGR